MLKSLSTKMQKLCWSRISNRTKNLEDSEILIIPSAVKPRFSQPSVLTWGIQQVKVGKNRIIETVGTSASKCIDRSV